MTDNSPIDSRNHFEKRNNLFKKIMSNVKSFIKNNVEETDPSSLEASKTEKSPDSNILKYEKYKKREAKRAITRFFNYLMPPGFLERYI